MDVKVSRTFARDIFRAKPGLVPLLVFVVLLGFANVMIVNQKAVLYLFYLPVVFAAWKLPKRDAVGIAGLAAAMVIAYVFFLPKRMEYADGKAFLWLELTIWGGILVVTAYMVSTLRSRTEEALRNLQRAYSGVLSILSKFIQTVDADTEAHSVRVSAWAVCIAKELELNIAMIEEVRIVGLLHDVGKVDVSVDILRKAASLSGEEQAEIRKHTAHGAAIIKPVGGMLSHIADAVETHHEKYDGSGYRGLKADEIPLAARIVATADAFDAMLSDRPYRKGMSVFDAMDSVLASAETHFDPRVVIALQTIVNRGGEQVVTDTLQTAGETSALV